MVDLAVLERTKYDNRIYTIETRHNIKLNRVVVGKISRFNTYYTVSNSVYTFSFIHKVDAKKEYNALVKLYNILDIANTKILDKDSIAIYLIEQELLNIKTISYKDYITYVNIIKFATALGLDESYINTIKHRFNHFKY